MKNKLLHAASAAFWIGVWWLMAVLVGREVLIPTPWQVLVRLWALLMEADFWKTLVFSLLRITAGFLAGVVLGTAAGALTAAVPVTEPLLEPLLILIKAAPVASFIILALVWMKADAIPVFISFLIVFPILQSNVRTGILAVPTGLRQMLQVFRVKPLRRVGALYVPAVLPYFSSACCTAFGMAWKAGVAAEVISLPMQSIGRELYFSRLYLLTPDVFAWTLTVVLLSLGMEKLLKAGLRRISKGGEKA